MDELKGADRLASACGSRFLAVAVAARRAREVHDYERGVIAKGFRPPRADLAGPPLSKALAEVSLGLVRAAEDGEVSDRESAPGLEDDRTEDAPAELGSAQR